MVKHLKRFMTLALIPALLGLALGWQTRVTDAQACSCIEPSWLLELESVTSSDPSVDHSVHWASRARVEGYENFLVWSHYDDGGPDKLHYLSFEQ